MSLVSNGYWFAGTTPTLFIPYDSVATEWLNVEKAMRVLIIEDNPKMAGAIQKGLQSHGFAADVSHSGFEGEDLAACDTVSAKPMTSVLVAAGVGVVLGSLLAKR